MGRGVSKILGRLARSARRLFGKNKPTASEERKSLIYVPGLPRKSGVVGCGRELERRSNRIRRQEIFEEETNQQGKTK